MKWFGGRESNDVEEGSSRGGRGLALGGGLIGLIGGIIYMFTGVNPAELLTIMPTISAYVLTLLMFWIRCITTTLPMRAKD